MAGIDKTYIHNFRDYKSVIDWCKTVGTVTDDYGNKITPIDYVYYPDVTEEEWNSWVKEYVKNDHNEKDFEMVLWNTPTPFDIWLIRNCPLDVIQDRLKIQYGGGWSKEAFTDHNYEDMYTQIKNHTSVYDTYTRGTKTSKNSKLKFKTSFGKSVRDKNVLWWIEVRNNKDHYPLWWYDQKNDKWFNTNEPYIGHSVSSTCHHNGALTKYNILNMVRKWNLPKGTHVNLECSIGHYIYWIINVEF